MNEMRQITGKDVSLVKGWLHDANIQWTNYRTDKEHDIYLSFYIEGGSIVFTFGTEYWKKSAVEKVSISFATDIKDERYKKSVIDVWYDKENTTLPKRVEFKNSQHNETRIVNALKKMYGEFTAFVDALRAVNREYWDAFADKEVFFNEVKHLPIIERATENEGATIGNEFTINFKGGYLKNFYDTGCTLQVGLPYDKMEKVMKFINELG